MSVQRLAWPLALALLAVTPWMTSTYATLALTSALALGLFALSYDLVLGVTGSSASRTPRCSAWAPTAWRSA